MNRYSMWGALLMSASLSPAVRAQDNVAPPHPALALSVIAPQAPVQQAGCPTCQTGGAPGMVMDGTAAMGMAGGGVYPQRNMPLYPTPTQSAQPWTGGAIITNQAFAPHEMLYPHKYHAMYPPFYYRVKGAWFWTPLGMRQHENWKLQGTEVKVNYRSTYAPFSGFHPQF